MFSDRAFMLCAVAAIVTSCQTIRPPQSAPIVESELSPVPPTLVQPTPIVSLPGSSLARYRGPNPYFSTPEFEVEYDPAIWQFVADDDSGRKAQLFQRNLTGCSMWLGAGPGGAQLLSTTRLRNYEWTIALFQPAVLQYSTALNDIGFVINVTLPEAYSTQVQSPCQQAAEDVLRTFRLVPAPTATSRPTRTPPPATRSPLAGVSGYIVFRHAGDLYRMNPDGSHRVQLTRNAGANLSPACASDGSRIAFISDRAGPPVHWQIYTMNADGSDQTRLTDSPSWDIAPAWSPDGKQITFASERAGRARLFVMQADGSNQAQLIASPEDVNSVAWSPDGTRLAFAANYAGSAYSHIFVVYADGSGLIDLTPEIDFAFSPAWSPDGEQIVFTATYENSNEIFVMNKDGSQVTRLTTTPADKRFWDKYQAAWSPDGKWMVYYSNVFNPDLGNADYQLWVMKADGTSQTRLTSAGVNDQPCWLADP